MAVIEADQFAQQIADTSRRFVDAPIDAAMLKVADELRDGFSKNFDNRVTEDGTRWPPHAPLTVALYGPHPLLILTGHMFASVTTEGAADNITRHSHREVELGTETDYAITHQEGTPRVPQREFLFATDEVLDKCGEIIGDAIMAEVF